MTTQPTTPSRLNHDTKPTQLGQNKDTTTTNQGHQADSITTPCRLNHDTKPTQLGQIKDITTTNQGPIKDNSFLARLMFDGG